MRKACERLEPFELPVPSWSPDGRRALSPLDGTDDAYFFPGGRQIAFERAVGPIVDNNAARVDIVTMHADGTHLRQLTQT